MRLMKADGADDEEDDDVGGVGESDMAVKQPKATESIFMWHRSDGGEDIKSRAQVCSLFPTSSRRYMHTFTTDIVAASRRVSASVRTNTLKPCAILVSPL